MTSLAKPNRVERFAPGTSVQIHSGRHAGKTGKAWRVFAGRVATEDHLMIELEGALPGWFVSVPMASVKATA